MRRSNGGESQVYMFFVRDSAVMVSGSGRCAEAFWEGLRMGDVEWDVRLDGVSSCWFVLVVEWSWSENAESTSEPIVVSSLEGERSES
jgi:hypothetical protein